MYFIRRILICLIIIMLLFCCLHAKRQQKNLTETIVFESGKDGYHTYRIPAILRTQKGTLLAFCEGRMHGKGDDGDIDLLLKRSEDDGRTWREQMVIWDDGTNTCGNPCVVQDHKTGTILLLATWNLGADNEHEIIEQESTDTRRVYLLYSSDDGKTWSEPTEITNEVKKPDWTWYATGPGIGIQLTRGKYRDRLIIPCDHIEAVTKKYYSHVFYSDDHGKTWHIGGSSPQDQVNECAVVELEDGGLMLNMRNYDRNKKTRQVCFSTDGGSTWTNQYHDEALIEPICHASLLRYSWREESQNRILFSNPADESSRINMTVRLSCDDGKTWQISKQLYSGGSAYSCLVKLTNDDVGCFYEKNDYQKIVLTRFPLEWLEEETIEKTTRDIRTNFAIISADDTMEAIIRKAAQVVPSDRQMAWQELEFIAFIHFTINTFTDKEWGDGTEDPALFNPTELDTRQWAKVCHDAGMKQIIVTAKHHDGFCLWPSQYTEHSLKNSPWRNGKGDVVGEVAQACREAGLKVGVYLSPWDRHEPSYGDSPKYNQFFLNQLRELLTNYGEISEVWFDGACGEGPNGKMQVYDWISYYKLIRELQPDAVIAIMGPDVRWVGTESGYGRETEWSVVPAVIAGPEKISDVSQHDIHFLPQGDMTKDDLGSREKIKGAKNLVWYPAEVDVSIRPGWFYHASEDDRVKSPEKLVDIYYSSVGRNAVLLLNLPPDRRGLIHEQDVASLMEMRRILDATFQTNLAEKAKVTASNHRNGHPADFVIDEHKATYWTTDNEITSATLLFEFDEAKTFDRLMLQEYIREGQRVESFVLEFWNGQNWAHVTKGTTIGYKRLLRFSPVTAQQVRLIINQSRISPTLCNFGLFKAPF